VLKEPLKKNMMIRLLRAQASDFFQLKNFGWWLFCAVAVARDYLLFQGTKKVIAHEVLEWATVGLVCCIDGNREGGRSS
jgi:hypothetical protein